MARNMLNRMCAFMTHLKPRAQTITRSIMPVRRRDHEH